MCLVKIGADVLPVSLVWNLWNAPWLQIYRMWGRGKMSPAEVIAADLSRWCYSCSQTTRTIVSKLFS